MDLGLYSRSDHHRPAIEVAVDRRRVHPRMLGVGSGSQYHGREGDRRTGGTLPPPRRAEAHPQRQRTRVHRQRDPALAFSCRRGGVVRRTWLAVGERLRRIVPQPATGRADQPRRVRQPCRGQALGRRLATGIQPPAAAQFAGLPDPGRVCRRLCCCFRSAYGLTPAAAQPKPQMFTITRYLTNTLITPGTENGGRPDPVSVLG